MQPRGGYIARAVYKKRINGSAKKGTLSFVGYIKKEISDTIKRKNQYFAYTHDKKGNGTFQDQKREMYLYIL